jgi:hypothetical protein
LRQEGGIEDRQEVVPARLAAALLQAQSSVFRHVELLADLGTQRGPPVFGDQVSLGMGIAPTVRDPDITCMQGTPQLPQGTELIVMPVDAAVRVHDVRPPFLGDEGRRRVWGYRASMGGVELLQHRHGVQQGIRMLRGVEGEGLQEGRGTLAQIAVARLEEIKIAVV